MRDSLVELPTPSTSAARSSAARRRARWPSTRPAPTSATAAQVERRVGADASVRVDVDGARRLRLRAGQRLRRARRRGRRPPGGPTTGRHLAASTLALERLTGALSDVGARTNRIENLQAKADDAGITLRSAQAVIEDIDLPKAILELQMQSTPTRRRSAPRRGSSSPRCWTSCGDVGCCPDERQTGRHRDRRPGRDPRPRAARPAGPTRYRLRGPIRRRAVPFEAEDGGVALLSPRLGVLPRLRARPVRRGRRPARAPRAEDALLFVVLTAATPRRPRRRTCSRPSCSTGSTTTPSRCCSPAATCRSGPRSRPEAQPPPPPGPTISGPLTTTAPPREPGRRSRARSHSTGPAGVPARGSGPACSTARLVLALQRSVRVTLRSPRGASGSRGPGPGPPARWPAAWGPRAPGARAPRAGRARRRRRRRSTAKRRVPAHAHRAGAAVAQLGGQLGHLAGVSGPSAADSRTASTSSSTTAIGPCSRLPRTTAPGPAAGRSPRA